MHIFAYIYIYIYLSPIRRVNTQCRHVSTALKLCFHAPHFSCLCSVFFNVHRGTYAPIGVGQIIIIIFILLLYIRASHIYTPGEIEYQYCQLITIRFLLLLHNFSTIILDMYQSIQLNLPPTDSSASPLSVSQNHLSPSLCGVPGQLNDFTTCTS